MIRAFVIIAFLCVRLAAADQWQQLADANRVAAQDPASARKMYEAILLDHPDFSAANYNLGTLCLQSDPKAAIDHLKSASITPQRELAAHALYNCALAYEKLGRYEDALTAIMQALDLKPDDADFIAARNELRRVYLARRDEARRKAEEEAKKLRLATKSLPAAHVGEAYAAKLEGAGGNGAPYRFSLAGEAKLPEGIELDGEGGLTGTPAASGVGPHELTIAVQDADKNDGSQPGTASGKITLTVEPAPAITTASLPEGVIDQPYSADLACIGLASPTWTATGLPDGLTITPGPGLKATITGTTATAQDASVTITAADPQRKATATLTLKVSDLFTAEESQLPPATAWAAYSHQMKVRGPAQQYHWTQREKNAAIAVADDGSITGTPDKAGDITLPLDITAADGRTRGVGVTLPVNPPPLLEVEDPIKIRQGEIVNKPLKLTGGTAPFKWEIAEGTLPKGLRLDPDGALRGAAGEVGNFRITIRAEDKWKAGTQQATTVQVDKPEDKGEQDSQQDQNQDQQAKNGEPSDTSEDRQGKPGDEDKNQQQPDGGENKDQQQGEQQQAKKDGEKKDDKDESATGKSAAEQAKEDAQQQAQVINGAAADRWLQQLPPEDRDVLRYQLLEGNQHAPRKNDKPW